MFVNNAGPKSKTVNESILTCRSEDNFVFVILRLKHLTFAIYSFPFQLYISTTHHSTHKITRSFYPLEEKNLILFIPKKIPFKITSRSSQGIVKRSFEVEASTRRYYANNENFVSRAEFTWNHSCVLHCSQKLFVRRDGCLGRWPFVSRG